MTISYDIDEKLLEFKCPKFLIQPVVENAVMHGVLPKQGFSTILIQVTAEQDTVVITVSNDGLPIPPEKLAEVTENLHKNAMAHKGLGLSSIRRRLHLLYGDCADLLLSSDEETCTTTVTIKYPQERGDANVSGNHSR